MSSITFSVQTLISVLVRQTVETTGRSLVEAKVFLQIVTHSSSVLCYVINLCFDLSSRTGISQGYFFRIILKEFDLIFIGTKIGR